MDEEQDSGEELRPEEILQALNHAALETHGDEYVAEFLREWAEKDAFVEDLEYVARQSSGDGVTPGDVFEHLCSSDSDYTIREMLEKSEELSENDWKSYPDVSSTGKTWDIHLGDIVEAPRQREITPLSGGYVEEAEFSENGKEIWVQQHGDGWYQTEGKPFSMDEFIEFFQTLEQLAPATCLHEVNYDGDIYYLNSEDLNYFSRFQDRFDDFDGEILRIESYFPEFVHELSVLPGEQEEPEYRSALFSEEGARYPLEAYSQVFSDELVKGMKTRLELNS